MPSLATSLPPELYSAILDHVPTISLQATTLSLSRALPLSPVPLYYLFQQIRLSHSDQVIRLYQRLRGADNKDTAAWVHDLSLESWSLDADVAINLVRLLPNLKSLNVFIGPSNFTPEHLEEMFAKPMEELHNLSLRFKPYVERATYYQFLKGAYFDTTLLAISQWPSAKLITLSIVQDPYHHTVAQKRTFAQPLVFFRLTPFTTLVRSPCLHTLKTIRLRIPSRQLTSFIATHPDSIPFIEYLDLSTCNVLDSDIDTMLVQFTSLKHLILDNSNVGRAHRDDEWAAIGKRCALIGARRAKEREKRLRAWLAASSGNTSNKGQTQEQVVPAAAPRVRRGRRGLATATISLRTSPPRDHISLPPIPKPDVSTTKIRVLPPSPSLRSLSATVLDGHATHRADFEKGWAEGIAQLSAARLRLRQSWGKSGMRVMKFNDNEAGYSDTEDEGLDGLVDVEKSDDPDFRVAMDDFSAPILCFAGAGRDKEHAEGCGHVIGWDTWKDEI